jgi:type III secretion protein Q
MIAQALNLPRCSAEDAYARRLLGRGASLDFDVAGEAGVLEITPGTGPSGGTPVTLECSHGLLTLSEPGAVLSLFGECPVELPAPRTPDDEWFWSLFNDSMSSPLRAVFGYLQPYSEQPETGIECRLQVRLGGAVITSRLSLSAQALCGLLQAGPWQSTPLILAEDWPLHAPMVLGQLSLPAHQLRNLNVGDVLIPEQALFDLSGHGAIRLGRHWLEVRLENQAAPLRLTVLALEETAMDHPIDSETDATRWDGATPYENDAVHDGGFNEAEGDVAADRPHAEPGRFDDLPLALTIRCGRLRMTLGELRNLAPGSVLEVEGPAPGCAALFYGERAVAHGELVEIDGRLGLQVTRVDVAG